MALNTISFGGASISSSSLSFHGSFEFGIPLRRTSVSLSPSRLAIHSMVVKRSPKRLKYASRGVRKEEGLLYVEADPQGADEWKLEPILQLIKDGAVGVIPTDTVYAIVCDLRNHSSIERLRRIKNIGTLKARNVGAVISTLSIPCNCVE